MAKKNTAVYIRSPKGVLNFAKLDEPDGKSDKYQCDLIFPKETTDLKPLQKAVKEAMVNVWGTDAKEWPMTLKAALKSIFKDGDKAIIKKTDELKCDKYPEYKNAFWIAPKTGYADSFQVVDQQTKKVIEELGRGSLLKSGNEVIIALGFQAITNEYGSFVSIFLGNILRVAEGTVIATGGAKDALSEFDDLLYDGAEDDGAEDDENFLD